MLTAPLPPKDSPMGPFSPNHLSTLPTLFSVASSLHVAVESVLAVFLIFWIYTDKGVI